MEVQQTVVGLVEIWLGRGGLLLDLAGAVLLYWGATPPTWRPSYGVIAPDDWEPGEEKQRYEQQALRWKKLSRAGLALLGSGFALQLIGTFARG